MSSSNNTPTNPSTCLPIHLFTYQPKYPSTCSLILPPTYPPIIPSPHSPIYTPIHPNTQASISLLIYLLINTSIHLTWKVISSFGLDNVRLGGVRILKLYMSPLVFLPGEEISHCTELDCNVIFLISVPFLCIFFNLLRYI